MIKAGSLFYAIVISLIIATTSSSFILSAYLSNIQADNFEINQLLHRNASSGYNLLLSQQTLVGVNQNTCIDLFDNGTDSVYLERKQWGAYEIAISKAVLRNRNVVRIGITGFCPNPEKTYSLYLADEDKPLSVCGSAHIKGKAFLPKAGIKRAYIEGQSFTGSTLIDGEIKQSGNNIPAFNKELLTYLQSVFTSGKITENDSILELQNGLRGDSIRNSFLTKTLVLSSRVPLVLNSGSYRGNITIVSEKQITISPAVELNDIVLFAPKIIIESGFKGNIQAFASDSLIVQKKVALRYPSVLGLIKNNTTLSPSAILLSEDDTVAGNIFVYKDLNNTQQAGLIIPEKTFIIGQVYSNGYVDLKGTINGSLMCSKIMLTTPSSVYENHLLGGIIDVSKLPPQYTGISLLEESMSKKTVKWLN